MADGQGALPRAAVGRMEPSTSARLPFPAQHPAGGDDSGGSKQQQQQQQRRLLYLFIYLFINSHSPPLFFF